MGAFDSAAGAPGGIGLHRRIHLGGRGPFESAARDDALDVFRCPREEYPSIQVDASLLFARDGNIYTSGGITAGLIWLWPWLKKISTEKLRFPPPG
jgi:hypothetical protein